MVTRKGLDCRTSRAGRGSAVALGRRASFAAGSHLLGQLTVRGLARGASSMEVQTGYGFEKQWVFSA